MELTLTVVDFLTARIDEDEAWWRLEVSDDPEMTDPTWAALRDRAVREAASKRAILGQSYCDGACHFRPWRVADLRDADHPCAVLLDLAAVYSDHADYDPAWAV